MAEPLRLLTVDEELKRCSELVVVLSDGQPGHYAANRRFPGAIRWARAIPNFEIDIRGSTQRSSIPCRRRDSPDQILPAVPEDLPLDPLPSALRD
jgi:hypothetical protein